LNGVLDQAREIEVTVTGRKSGNQSTRPVWFTAEGETIYLLPEGGSGSNWYRNLERTPRIRLAVGGAHMDTDAKPINDAAKVKHVVDTFRDKYGSEVTQYYAGQDVAVQASLGSS
jgi:deazaflavin-dependent oxidoreductase (nitroreductase family)